MKFCVKGMEEGGHVVILVFLDVMAVHMVMRLSAISIFEGRTL
jgi:hypothetical protein